MFVYFLNLVFNECLLYINSQERCNTLSGLIYWWGPTDWRPQGPNFLLSEKRGHKEKCYTWLFVGQTDRCALPDKSSLW